jgi:SAM-dependent methyltransferase
MSRYNESLSALYDNEKKESFRLNESGELETPSRKFELFGNSIQDLYVNDESVITDTQSEFYNDVKFPNYDTIDDFGSLVEKANKGVFAKKLDDEIPWHGSVLEAGCGTGQLSLFLSRFNRKIYSIDLSRGSLELGENFRKNNSIQNVFFFRMNIFNLMFRENYFDVVVSNGVLHHTKDARTAFGNLANVLKTNGIIVIGLYHRYGRIVTHVRQKINLHFGNKVRVSDTHLKKNISDEKKYAWFRDQYENPHETTHTLSEIYSWFDEHNIEYLSSLPFDFDPKRGLFEKRERPKNPELLFSELSQAFSPSQIREGGFFIIIGKKRE